MAAAEQPVRQRLPATPVLSLIPPAPRVKAAKSEEASHSLSHPDNKNTPSPLVAELSNSSPSGTDFNWIYSVIKPTNPLSPPASRLWREKTGLFFILEKSLNGWYKPV